MLDIDLHQHSLLLEFAERQADVDRTDANKRACCSVIVPCHATATLCARDFDSPLIGCYMLAIGTYGPSLTALCRVIRLAHFRFRPPAYPRSLSSDSDTMKITALRRTAEISAQKKRGNTA